MATVLTPGQKLEGLKLEILEMFEELFNYLSVHKQKLLSRLIRIKEDYDKNTELNAAIKQLRSAKDSSNCRIQVFNTERKFLHSFENDQLQTPFAICLSKEFVFITDEVKNCVTEFTLEGMF